MCRQRVATINILHISKKLSPAETRYSAFDRELLVVYTTIRHFRHNLKGREVSVNTDHKPVTYIMSSTSECPSLRQTRHMAYIAEFTTDIRYVKGETNFVADALSRPSVSAIGNALMINYKELSVFRPSMLNLRCYDIFNVFYVRLSAT